MLYYFICYGLWVLDRMVSSTITGFGFEPKKDNVKRWKYILGLFLVQIPFITLKFIFNWNSTVRSVGWILTVTASTLYLIFMFKGYIWQKILFVLFEVICCCMAEWLTQLLLQDILLQIEGLYFNQPIMVIYIVFVEILFVIFFLFFMLLWKKFILKKGYDLKVFFIFIIFPISQIIMLSNINFRILSEMTPANMAAVISLVLGIVADVLLLFLLLRQQSMYEIEVKLAEVEKAWQVEQNHYRDIEARREELAKIRHDISEHFVVMQELLHQGNYEKVVEMLYTLKQYVASTKEYVYCGDPVINAIMAENERECRKKGVVLNYTFEIMQPLKINPVVICSIFSNLMRNSLAAVEEVEDRSKAVIEIKAAVKGDYLIVKVDNPFITKKKKDKKRKGYGLEILRTMVDRYHGQMDVVTENNVYSTRITVENVEMDEKSSSL